MTHADVVKHGEGKDFSKVTMIEYIRAAHEKDPNSIFRFDFVNHDSLLAKVAQVGADWLELHPHKRNLLKYNVAHILSFQDVTGDKSYEWKDWTAGRKEEIKQT